ncbi:PSP-domain-containing protein [Endogone sp. FLAS-F59071]|nr:PSP-domain-containing protein [Endogone sp. FLAS-F59071]|eukprot:RUS20737.1 PSP-domain-containing protein [Endogone sp. FLAS-F59071]
MLQFHYSLLKQKADHYYEGKEFETKLKEKKPGSLSEELKVALNIPPLAPPPWLINMQYHGPPPSYPNLKIPGLNAPIPEGAQWGYHPGGWGRPPVDEVRCAVERLFGSSGAKIWAANANGMAYNRPLYGDVFGVMGQDVVPPEIVQPIERKLWGELESEEEESESEEESEEGSEVEAEATAEDATLKEGLVTPSGLASVASTVPSGLETPDFIELRKDPRTRGGDDGDENPRQLYTVIPEVQRSITGFMGSQHGYDLSAAKAPAAGTKRKIVGEGVEVSLDASELEGLDEETLRRKFEEQQAAAAIGEGMAAPNKEDFSDMVAEHANKQAKKRKKMEEGKKDGKKSKEFKF